MRSRISIVLVAMIIIGVGTANGQQRSLRSTGIIPELNIHQRHQPDDYDEERDTLKYEDPANPRYFFYLPDEYGDDLVNVRFTPTFDPYYLAGVLIPIFDMENINGGPAGTPGVRVSIYESGYSEIEPDSLGYPIDIIGSVDFPYIDSTGFPRRCRADSLVWEYFDLSSLHIGPRDRGDFHIAVSLIGNPESDTLSIFFDDGIGANRTDRSGIWDGQDSTWVKMKDVPGIELMCNFYMRAVITDERPWSVGSGDNSVQPFTVLLDPAYPNPFNNSTTLRFSVPASSPYQILLFDQQGRQLRQLGMGTGKSGILSLDASSLTNGTYFVTLVSPSGRISQPVHLIR